MLWQELIAINQQKYGKEVTDIGELRSYITFKKFKHTFLNYIKNS